jgi:hypothetical protein
MALQTVVQYPYFSLICAQQFLHQFFASQCHRMTEMTRRKISKIAVFADSGT